jgi:SAM-dependent methyltransferase
MIDRLRKRLSLMLDPEREIRQRSLGQLENAVRFALNARFDGDLLPPEDLRLHVGTNTTAANFWGQGASSARRVARLFGSPPPGPVLDWGCGSGRTLNWLKAMPGWREAYYGCDVDPAAIEWLRNKGFANVAACGDLPPLPYPDNFFAGAFAFSVLTHIRPEHHGAWYAELARVLRPGGRAFLTTQGSFIVERLERPEPALLASFQATGAAYQTSEGHYKDAALVSEAFTRAAASPYLEFESYDAPGYANMDAFVVRKPG